MTAVRAVLIATIILGLAATPLVAPVFGGASLNELTAYAAFSGGAGPADQVKAVANTSNGNGNGNNNGNGNGNRNFNNNNDNNSNGNGNGNSNGNGNGNSNNNGNGNGNRNSNGNGNGNDNVRIIIRRPNESINRPTKCFDNREVGVIQLGNGSYDVTVTVQPNSSLGQTTRMTLRAIDPSTVPSPGNLVDSVVFQLDAQSSCDGAHIGTLPNLVNMGIVYNVPNVVDKSKLQIVRWDGSTWTNVDTVPDPTPGNPYVSTTVSLAGTYALIQKP